MHAVIQAVKYAIKLNLTMVTSVLASLAVLSSMLLACSLVDTLVKSGCQSLCKRARQHNNTSLQKSCIYSAGSPKQL